MVIRKLHGLANHLVQNGIIGMIEINYDQFAERGICFPNGAFVGTSVAIERSNFLVDHHRLSPGREQEICLGVLNANKSAPM